LRFLGHLTALPQTGQHTSTVGSIAAAEGDWRGMISFIICVANDHHTSYSIITTTITNQSYAVYVAMHDNVVYRQECMYS
jgi:hypothetical protein